MTTKTRAEVAAFVSQQMEEQPDELYRRKRSKSHYGKQELKDLLDFLYDGPPKTEEEKLTCDGMRYS